MKWVPLVASVICWGAAFLLATGDGYYHRTAVLLLVGAAFANFAAFVVMDWRQERSHKRHLENERAISRERAKIVGDFVHGRKRDDR